MKDKINIAELLKDCPQGMELDCYLFNGLKFDHIDTDNENYPIICRAKTLTGESNIHTFTKYGWYTASFDYSKCVIYPKGKTTWEGFVPPCQFKDGDIVFSGVNLISIFKGIKEGYRKSFHSYVSVGESANIDIDKDFWTLGNIRFATEEEKQKLFDAIKANGYEWNAETKTLEKLNTPKEEPIEDKGNISDGYHTFNELYEYRLLYNASMFNELAKQCLYDVHKSKKHSDGTIPFGDKNWFIVQAELPTGQISNHYEMKDWGLFNIPEKEKANPYDGHTPQDVTKRLREFLSLESEQDEYELVPNKFNITNLKPFESKVLIRDTKSQKWSPAIWGFYDSDAKDYKYKLVGVISRYCIPYEGNEHLLGKTNDCDEHFKTWK